MPKGATSTSSQDLDTIYNDLVTLLSPAGATDLYRRQVESSKPSLKTSKKAQLAALDNMNKLVQNVRLREKLGKI